VSLVIVTSLAIGIGANTAIFSVVNALLLKQLPYPDAHRLAVLWLRSPGINIPQDWPSPGQYIDIRNENRSFERDVDLAGSQRHVAGPRRAATCRSAAHVVQPLSSAWREAVPGPIVGCGGRQAGRPAVVILSHGFWKRAFGGDPAVVGRALTLNVGVAGAGEAKNLFEVAGVTGPDLLLNEEIMPTVASIRQVDVFLPLPLGADAVNRRGDENYNLMARLKPGVSMAQRTRTWSPSPAGFERRTSETGPSRSTWFRSSSQSSATSGSRFSCCWAR